MARLSSRSEFDPRTGSLLSASTALFFLVGAASLLGGGARSDVTSPLLLRALAVLVLPLGLLALTSSAERRVRDECVSPLRLWWSQAHYTKNTVPIQHIVSTVRIY